MTESFSAAEAQLALRLGRALEKLIKIAHPMSSEAQWAAGHLDELGKFGHNHLCLVCGHARYRHRRNHCAEPYCAACAGFGRPL